MQKAITPTEYKAFQKAYDFFNKELFQNTLPNVLVTLQRKSRYGGYFAANRFKGRTEETTAHELALNPDHFTGASDEHILSILAHEMAHAWQQTHGKPPTRCYHDRQWGAKMKEIGLYPSSTGEPGGKETGQRMAHYIIPSGPYALAFAKLLATGFELHWQSAPPSERAKKSKESKTKFTCPECGMNLWGKPDAAAFCALCHEEDGELHLMLAEA
jgi:hypothetical protein